MAHRECYQEAARLVDAEAVARGARTHVGDAMRLLAVEMRQDAQAMPSSEPTDEPTQIIAYLQRRIGGFVNGDFVPRDLRNGLETFLRVIVREIQAGEHRRAP